MGFIARDQYYFISLLNHNFMSRAVSCIIIGVISLAVRLEREETLKENEVEANKV